VRANEHSYANEAQIKSILNLCHHKCKYRVIFGRSMYFTYLYIWLSLDMHLLHTDLKPNLITFLTRLGFKFSGFSHQGCKTAVEF
jgi:hypothetical protein